MLSKTTLFIAFVIALVITIAILITYKVTTNKWEREVEEQRVKHQEAQAQLATAAREEEAKRAEAVNQAVNTAIANASAAASSSTAMNPGHVAECLYGGLLTGDGKYCFFSGEDSSYGDDFSITPQPTMVSALTKCTEDAGCVGVNTDKIFKKKIRPYSHWDKDKWRGDVTKGLYVKKGTKVEFLPPCAKGPLDADPQRFCYFPGKYSPDGDLEVVAGTFDVRSIMSNCVANSNCVAFTTAGQLKKSVADPAKWVGTLPSELVSYETAPDAGMYIKKDHPFW